MEIETKRLLLVPEDILTIDKVVRDVARWNRNGYAHREVILVTSDITSVRQHGVRVKSSYHKDLGRCWYVGSHQGMERKVIWIRGGQTPEEELYTVVHELVHGYSGTTISHEEAFRRFCTIATLAVLDAFPHLRPTDFKVQTWTEALCMQYQRYSHHNPYEADKHIAGYRAYKGSDN